MVNFFDRWIGIKRTNIVSYSRVSNTIFESIFEYIEIISGNEKKEIGCSIFNSSINQ